MKHTLSTLTQTVLASLLLTAGGFHATAADIAKANNATALNATTSWSNNVVPTASDRMLFTNNITGASLAVSLGGNVSANGILYGVNAAGAVVSPLCGVTVNPTAGSALTIGAGGITNGSSTNFTLNCAVALGASQTWGVATNRTVTIGGVLSGLPTTNLTIRGPGIVTLSGSNTFYGNVVVDGAGELRINHPTALSNCTSVTINAILSGTVGNKLGLNGFSTPATTAITMIGSNTPSDMRSSINTAAGSNVVNGPINLMGTGTCQLTCNSGHTLVFNGSMTASPGFTGLLFVRGVGPIIINSPSINLGPTGRFSRTDAGVATLNTSGHTWVSSDILTGTLKLGVDNALPTNRPFTLGQSGGQSPVFDLGGFNQTLTNLVVNGSMTNPRNALIGNSSTNADSLLTIQGGGTSTFIGTLLDSVAGGTRKLGLTVTGGSSLTLTSTNTYSGPTTITGAGSKLVVPTVQTGSGSFSVGDGATLGVTAATAGATLQASSITLGGGGMVTNIFNLGSGNPLAPVVYATNLAVNGTVYVNVTGAGQTPGQFALIKYGSATGISAGTFVAVSLPPGATSFLSNNVANSSIDLVIASAPLTLWTGTTNDGSAMVFASRWDINNTTNWVDGVTFVSQPYTDGLAVQFDDTAAGTNYATLATNVSPAAITFDNSAKNYTLAGTYGVIGTARLTKNGSGILTVSTTNAYTGDTVINAGTFRSGSTNAIPAGSGKGNVVLNGTLDVNGFLTSLNGLNGAGSITNSSASLSDMSIGNDNQSSVFTGPIQSFGTLRLTKSGTGTTRLAGNNSWTGNLTLSSGTLEVAGPGPSGTLTLGGVLRVMSNFTNNNSIPLSAASTINVDPGATLQLNGAFASAQNVTKIGSGNLILTGSGSSYSSFFPRNGTTYVIGNASMVNGAYVSVGLNQNDDATVYYKDNATNTVTGADYNIGDTANAIGRVYLQDNAKLFLKNLWVGKNTTCQGYIYQSGGAITNAAAASSDWQIGGGAATAAGAFGGYYMSGGRLDVKANFQIGAYGTGEMIITNGLVNVSNGWPVVGRYAGGVGRLVIAGGQFNQLSTSGTAMIIGEAGTGSLVVSNTGLLVCSNTFYISSSNGAPGSGSVLLATGGTITAPKVSRNAAGGYGTLAFDGGTLRAGASSLTFLQNIDSASILNGGAILDSAGYSVVIAQPLLAGGTGGVTKTSSGTVALSGTNTFTGPATVNAGKLTLTTFHAGGGAITVADAASLGVEVGAADTSLNSSTVSLGSGSAVDYNFGSFGNPSMAPLRATNLTLNGTVTINVLAGNLAVGNVKLITYDNPISGAGNFVIGTLPKGVIADPTLVTNGNTIELVVTYVSSLTWAGTINADWDIGLTTNWVLDSVGQAYAQDSIPGDSVRFDDSITTGVTNVNLATNVSPFSITVSNALFNYTFNGTNKITGPTAITKAGSGSLRINTTNDFTGSIKVTGGTIIPGNASAFGVTNAGLTVSGSGALDVNGQALGLKPVTVSGAGPDGLGAIVNRGVENQNALRNVTLAGNTTFGGISNRWDIRAATTTVPGAILSTSSNAYNLTKVGPYDVVLVSVNVDPALADVAVREGTLSLEVASTGLGNPTNEVTVYTNATLRMYGNYNALQKQITLLDGGRYYASYGTSNTATRTLTLQSGSNLVETASGASLALQGPVVGAGNLVKLGAGNLYLTGTNTYSGGSTLLNGVVIVGSASAFGPGPINLFTNASGVSANRIQITNSVTIANTLILPANSSGTTGRGALEAIGGSFPIWSGPINLYGAPAAGGTFYSDATSVLTLTGPVTVYGAVIPSQRDGTVVYSGGGSYTNFNLTGVARIGAVNGMATNVSISIGASAGAVLDLNGFDQTLAAILKGGSAALVTNSSLTPSVLTIGRDSDSTFSGVIGGNLSLVKGNTNALTLSSANTYSGTTTVRAGALIVNGNQSSSTGAVLATGGGTLKGTGTLGGSVTIDDGGTLATGTSIGTLTMLGSLTFASGSTASMRLGDSLTADKAASSGSVTYAGKLKLTWAGGTMTTGGPYKLFNGTSYSGAFTTVETANWNPGLRVNLSGLAIDGTISIISNTAPTALNLSLSASKNSPVSFAVDKYASDAEGDQLAISVTQPAHGVVSLVNGVITYTPFTDYTGPDGFTYSATDTYGATATGNVTVTVSGSSGSGANVASISVTNGTATITSFGIPGATYGLQFTDDLTSDVWTDLPSTAVAATTPPLIGQFTLTDTSAPPSGRFYRTKYISGP